MNERIDGAHLQPTEHGEARQRPRKRYLREISAKKGVPAPAACASGSS